MVLLLAPLCAAAARRGTRDVATLRTHTRDVLCGLTLADAEAVYQAIAAANPGGLGKARQGDVTAGDVLPLTDAMSLAANRDAIARQYVTGCDTLFDHVVPDLADAMRRGMPLDDAIVQAHVRQMAREPDSLICRKCGPTVAAESQRRAATALAALDPRAALMTLDQWLRNGEPNGRAHARNPGTTADLIAAGLFIALWTGLIATTFTWNGLPHPNDVVEN
jgi:triphosphoribosyl-dephospho-CoA synthase